MMELFARLTNQGTAAAETALCAEHNTPANQEHDRTHPRPDIVGEWVECENDELRCQVCGINIYDERDPDA